VSGRPALEADLERAGKLPDSELELAGTALLLAALDRPRVALARYRDHLAELAAQARAELGDGGARAGDLQAAAAALGRLLSERHRYQGDALTYDDMQNANLMRVIDRRKGLPVALGILYLHAARGAGLQATGIAFPAHFLIRVARGGERLILDPFAAGRMLETSELRELAKRLAGPEAELDPGYVAPVNDREVLLRLQNNILSRALGEGRLERAAEVAERMLLLAPGRALLYRELALVAARLGNLKRARAAAEAYLARADGPAQAHDAALLLQKLKSSLN
jgi:regulator of sirC expression with transglutaminase-like and TPR domain